MSNARIQSYVPKDLVDDYLDLEDFDLGRLAGFVLPTFDVSGWDHIYAVYEKDGIEADGNSVILRVPSNMIYIIRNYHIYNDAGAGANFDSLSLHLVDSTIRESDFLRRHVVEAVTGSPDISDPYLHMIDNTADQAVYRSNDCWILCLPRSYVYLNYDVSGTLDIRACFGVIRRRW